MANKRGRLKRRGRPAATAKDENVAVEESKEESPSELEVKKPEPPKNGRKSKSIGRVVAMRLADKPEKLTKADVMCPICWSTLFEPTTLPCNHSLCEQCFRKHVADTSLNCPCCRMRLSVWCRKVMKGEGESLLDVALWERMKKEFPRLVEARIQGQDTQNIFEECSQALFLSPDSPTQEEPGLSRKALDGTICDEPGAIRSELQEMIRQHQTDMENERLRDERASASLIQQIQEEEGLVVNESRDKEDEDFLLAQRLQKEFEEEEKQHRFVRRSQQAPGPSKTLPRNLVKEWTSAHSPDIIDLPRLARVNRVNQAIKKSPRTSKTSKRTAKKKSTVTKSKPSVTPQRGHVSRASQDFMNKFLTPSPSTPPISDDQPCCSKSIPLHDVRHSAFSPTKPTSNVRLFVPAVSLAIPVSSSTDNCLSSSQLPDEQRACSNKTPDSINSEVDRHFRPIRGAPKTPPRRRADGKFLPEPKLVRTTPLKPTSSANISAYICSPQKRNPEAGSRPSCATMEKRISNDSGRASDDSRSPETTNIIRPNVGYALPLPSYQPKERGGCVSEDYRVTPDEKLKTPEYSKKRQHSDDTNDFCLKKVKMEPTLLGDSDSETEKQEVTISPFKTEPDSPSLMDDDNEQKHVPLRFDITCTQGVITIDGNDDEYLEAEQDALKLFREKAEQEAADRAFAEALQRDLNGSERNPRSRPAAREKYSLRSWLNKPQVKQEVKTEAGLGD